MKIVWGKFRCKNLVRKKLSHGNFRDAYITCANPHMTRFPMQPSYASIRTARVNGAQSPLLCDFVTSCSA